MDIDVDIDLDVDIDMDIDLKKFYKFSLFPWSPVAPQDALAFQILFLSSNHHILVKTKTICSTSMHHMSKMLGFRDTPCSKPHTLNRSSLASRSEDRSQLIYVHCHTRVAPL